MADANFDHFESGFRARETAQGGSFLVNLAGAATSVALIVGLGYWGYELAMRDMTGIPVVRALEGPMRIAPQDPGGEIAAHQGLSVNSVAAEGGASRPSDRLILAPQPVNLASEDTAGIAVAVLAPISGRSSDASGVTLAELGDASETDRPALLDALNEALEDSAVPLSAEVGDEAESPASYTLPKGALSTSPRPMPRPGNVQMASASTASDVPEMDGASLAAGTRLVQLGAFNSAETARNEWERLTGKFGDLLYGKTRVVQAAQSSGRTFYRLRALGFEDDAESRRFCSALVAERAACIPVTVR